MLRTNFSRTFLVTLVVAKTIILSSCTSTRVMTIADCADAVGVKKDTTVFHYFWGLKQVSEVNPGCDERYNHLNGVTVKTTPGNILLSVITLGIVVPQKLSWCCAPYNPTPGTLGTKR